MNSNVEAVEKPLWEFGGCHENISTSQNARCGPISSQGMVKGPPQRIPIDPSGGFSTASLAVMSPHKVDRARVKQLTDLPNVGKATADDLRLLGVYSPEQITGECPFEMYERLCRKTGHRHDPCVIDVFMSVTHFMKGELPRPWWEFTEMRKNILAGGTTK